MTEIEIIAIGSEVLLGDVLDTNSHWLCRQFTLRGGQVRRVVQVRDELEAVAREMRGALQRGADVVVTTGGLGPTDDDITLEAVAAALGRPLVEHPHALVAIRGRYSELAARGTLADAALTPARRKMARLPAGAEPVDNPVGTAPAVVLREGKTVLTCLPGVPEELQGIFVGPLSEALEGLLGTSCYAEWTVLTSGAGESTLAPLLRRVVVAHPDVYIKSLAQYPYQGQVRVTLSLSGADAGEIEAGLQAALDDLVAVLAEAGVGVERVEQD